MCSLYEGKGRDRTALKKASWNVESQTVYPNEVDFVLYGERGLTAVEVKFSHKIRAQDYKGLLEFLKDYPQAKVFVLANETKGMPAPRISI